jgi:hypothetical protein
VYHQPHPGVDSNDALYGLAPDYTAQLKAKAQELLQQALADVSSDAATADSKVCAPFSLLLDGVCGYTPSAMSPHVVTCRIFAFLYSNRSVRRSLPWSWPTAWPSPPSPRPSWADSWTSQPPSRPRPTTGASIVYRRRQKTCTSQPPTRLTSLPLRVLCLPLAQIHRFV